MEDNILNSEEIEELKKNESKILGQYIFLNQIEYYPFGLVYQGKYSKLFIIKRN